METLKNNKGSVGVNTLVLGFVCGDQVENLGRAENISGALATQAQARSGEWGGGGFGVVGS